MNPRVYINLSDFGNDEWVPYQLDPEKSGLDDVYKCLIPPYDYITIEYSLIISDRYYQYIKLMSPIEVIKYVKPHRLTEHV